MSETEEKKEQQPVEWVRDTYFSVRDELAKIIKGQEEVLDQVLVAFFAGGW